jgi:chorismate mutase/prephenate dehydratase
MDLEKLRENIDSIDRQIVSLINERYKYVKEVGKWKQDRAHAIYVPEREKALLEKLEAINDGPMEDKTLRAIYREIMSGALALEHPMQVGYLGPQATFSHLAAMGKFGHSVQYEPKSNIADVFRAVESERLDYGCVPIENSTEGAVNHTLDMFTDSSVQICAEMNLRIHHNLMAKCEMSEIKKVYSHAQVLGQCRIWLQENMPSVEIIEVASSTKAAEIASEEQGSAAIASALAAEIYKLKMLHEKIEDNAHNTTRFMVLGRQAPVPTGDDKTSICFSIKDRVGALYDCLLPFKEEEITLTMIESRPSRRRKWEYFFFIDLLGHSSEEKIKRALDKLGKLAQTLRILGSYPRSNVML